MSELKSKKEMRIRLNYQLVVQNLPFILFLSMLAVVYIYNGHYSDKLIKEINRTAKELKELQFEFKTVKREVMFRSKQSELAKAIEPMGLKELMTPTIVLADSTNQ